MRDVSQKLLKIKALRSQVQALEGLPISAADVLPLGAPEIDQALPWGGLPLNCLHHFVGGEAAVDEYGFVPSATMFAASVAARLKEQGSILWCLPRYKTADSLYTPALEMLGLDSEALVIARARNKAEVLWVMEEALGCAEISCVIGSLDSSMTLTAERRLQLAAERGGSTGFLIQSGKKISTSSAAVTRWRIQSAPSVVSPWSGIGRSRWSLILDRCRQGKPHAWMVEWCDETCDFSVVASVCDRSFNTGSKEQRATSLRAVA